MLDQELQIKKNAPFINMNKKFDDCLHFPQLVYSG